MEFEGYKYNDYGVCLNPTIFAKYDDGKGTKFELYISKTENGYTTGGNIMTGPPDYYGGSAGCSYNYSKKFATEKEAKLHRIDSLMEFLQDQAKGKKGVAEAMQYAKEFKFSILHKQLELF